MTDFFISYNSADVRWATWIHRQLTTAGYEAAIQAYDSRPGENFVIKMQQATSRADRTIAVLSPDYLAALYTQPEWAAAFLKDPTGEKRTLIPIRVRECTLEGLLGQITYIDLLHVDEATARRRLIDGITEDTRRKPRSLARYPGTGQALAPSSQQRFPKVWNVPLLRNPQFTGRETVLESLSSTFQSSESTMALTLTGLGGIGKTQLVNEFAHRASEHYDVVWWVCADHRITLRQELHALALRLGLIEQGVQGTDEAIELLTQWLDGNARWLLIFDDARHPSEVKALLPTGGQGHLLVTSRRTDWGKIPTVPIEEFFGDEALHFVVQRGLDIEDPAVTHMIRELGSLPLALDQAASYLIETGISPQHYLDLLRAHRLDVLEKGTLDDYDGTVATTWRLSFQALDSNAAALAHFCAFLAPEAIPYSLLIQGRRQLPERLMDVASHPASLGETAGHIQQHSLVRVRNETIFMHRLVQAVARRRCPREAAERMATSVLRALGTVYHYDENDLTTWRTAGQLAPHIKACAQSFQGRRLPGEAAGTLGACGHYLLRSGALDEALVLMQTALDLSHAHCGLHHPHLGRDANNLGQVLRAQGDLNGALYWTRQALRISQHAYGQHHPEVAINANNLGQILKAQGHLQEALEWTQLALEIDLNTYGNRHPNVAIRANNLGQILREQGKLSAALRWTERALEIDQEIYGLNHPSVARDASNLGQILRDQGDLDPALEWTTRALTIDQATFGPKHPKVAIRANNLGTILQDMGDPYRARRYLRRALSILEGSLGRDHPTTTLVRKNLEHSEHSFRALTMPDTSRYVRWGTLSWALPCDGPRPMRRPAPGRFWNVLQQLRAPRSSSPLNHCQRNPQQGQVLQRRHVS